MSSSLIPPDALILTLLRVASLLSGLRVVVITPGPMVYWTLYPTYYSTRHPTLLIRAQDASKSHSSL